MKFQIERMAFKFLLNVLLSCRCPVSDNTEKKLINYYKRSAGKDVVNYESILKIAEKEGKETVFNKLREFCLYSINDFSKNRTILVNDILRHFCTAYHWHVVEESLPHTYKDLTDIPSWFVSHMLLPVELSANGGTIQGTFIDSEGYIVLRNLFLPSDLKIREGSLYCVHFASAIGEISLQQSKLLRNHLAEIPDFQNLRKQVFEIDFHNFQRFGDYTSFCKERFGKYF